MSQRDELRRYVAEAEQRLQKDQQIEWITPAPRRPADRSDTVAAIDLAASRSMVGTLEEGTRLPRLKRFFLRTLRLVTHDQNAFNAAVVEALQSLEATQAADLGGLNRRLAESVTAMASLDAEVSRLGDQIQELGDRMKTEAERLDGDAARRDAEHAAADESHRQLTDLVHEISRTLGATADRIEATRTDLQGVRTVVTDLGQDATRQKEALRLQDDRLTVLLREARRRLPELLDQQQLRTFNDQLARRFDALYTEFENRYRGSRAEIVARLTRYVDILDLEAVAELGPVADIGSGRGEWLELLRDHDVAAYGIDVNTDIAAAAEQRGLDVRIEDGLEHLEKVDPGTLGMVSMFHVAEHLEFETLFDVMRAARRALAPRGILLIETPNPSNLTVGASSFYLDPTHIAPVHPLLVEFLAMAAGFSNTAIHYLNPSDEPPFTLADDLAESGDLGRVFDHLNWALLGPRDYALIAHGDLDPQA